MHYGRLNCCDVANGTGVRVTLFVSGCRNHCKGCFQPETWDFSYGELFTDEIKQRIFKGLAKPHIKGLTVLGGEPFEPENQHELLPLLREIKERFPDKDIWCFTGYRLDDELLGDGHPHTDDTVPMLELIDTLVDGRFVEELKDISLKFRGSSNQRILDKGYLEEKLSTYRQSRK